MLKLSEEGILQSRLLGPFSIVNSNVNPWEFFIFEGKESNDEVVIE